MLSTTEEKIRQIFEELIYTPDKANILNGEVNACSAEIQRVKKNKDYAFVHFNTREAAELAMQRVIYICNFVNKGVLKCCK